MTSFVQVLQIASGVAWLLPTLMLAPGAVRTLFGKADALDAMRSPIFYVGATQIGFSVRWAIWPHSIPVMESSELSFWSGLYVLSTMCAVGVAITNRAADGRRK